MSKETLHQLVYVSSASRLFTPAELLSLLDQSRLNNGRRGITGLLLYREGNFMQVLEGDGKAVLETHAKIQMDRRHGGLITMKSGPVMARSFGDGSMAFRNLDVKDAAPVPGYSDFLNQTWVPPASGPNADAAVRLLEIFRQGMRG